eukprot:TRINITY_DN2325_c0_g1_i8.p1 TRINITY_DN2325_c0_g1~~TRINITY_DN2325_c0_g1_i8.p1  ORF type:complete len:611 (+),score=103.09 TRINITY_DN2325_c0_g1_i8:69-1901(+)
MAHRPTPSDKLTSLRALMRQHSLAAYIVRSDDPHMSEYVADCWQRRAFISEFTGSAGTAVVTLDSALLWTDGRYYLQAEKQLDQSLWTLMRMQERGVPDIFTWLGQNLPDQAAIGVDPATMSIDFAESLISQCQASNKSMVFPAVNLVDQIWGSSQPAFPSSKVNVHDMEHAGESVESKLTRIRLALVASDCSMTILTALDQVAWTLNIRGWDVTCNPVIVSYLIVSLKGATLFIDSAKLDEKALAHLSPFVEILPYESFLHHVSDTASKLDAQESILLEPSSCNYAVFRALNGRNVKLEINPVNKMKAIKNEVELAGFRRCHIRDAVALITYLCWLEDSLNDSSSEPITEFTGAVKLESLRRELSGFVGLSFDSISGFGSNGAIVHYKPEESSAKVITKDEVYLIDSGAQYLDGTTDVTRTLHFGAPTEHERKCFTHVLKGHIALDSVKFPPNETGVRLDILARTPLWSIGLDYEHGTGHGVGAFLNVHEGPHYVGKRNRDPKLPSYPIMNGMTVTNEPGYYETNNFGMRIENVVLVRPASGLGQDWLRFERVTMVPIQKKMIDTRYLTDFELEWVNSYHRECFEKVGPLLVGRELEYLRDATSPLTRA